MPTNYRKPSGVTGFTTEARRHGEIEQKNKEQGMSKFDRTDPFQF